MNKTLLWIPLFPLLGAMFNLLFGGLAARGLGERRGKEMAHMVAIGVVAFSFFLTVLLALRSDHGLGLAHLLRTGELVDSALGRGPSAHRIVERVGLWFASGETRVYVDLVLDNLSALVCGLVTSVGLLVHVAAVGAMAEAGANARYFAYLNLLVASVLIVVLAKSLALMLVGWVGVGACASLLTGFRFAGDANAAAARTVFVAHRVGDACVVMGMLVVYAVTGSFDFDALRSACAAAGSSPMRETGAFGGPAATAATLFFGVGCGSRSAQLPFHVWLPRAMNAPAAGSVLIHTAAVVPVGAYLGVRLNFLFALAPTGMVAIAVVGGLTAVLGATVSAAQTDLKQVLAYLGVSQLGLMFLALGMGAWVAALLHMVVCAFCHACVLLGACAVVDACDRNRDIRTMGGLRRKMPVTGGTFLIGCLALVGAHGVLLASYTFASAWSPGLNYAGYLLGLLATGAAAFAAFRAYFLVFGSTWRGDGDTWTHCAREHWIVSGPLVALAALAAGFGLLGGPLRGPHRLDVWLAPVQALSARFTGDYALGLRARADGTPHWFAGPHDEVGAGAALAFVAVQLAVVGLGVGFARARYKNGPSRAAQGDARGAGLFGTLCARGYFADEICARLVVQPMRMAAIVVRRVVDEFVIDTVAVGGTARARTVLGKLVRSGHKRSVHRYTVVMLTGAAVVLGVVYCNPTVSKLGPTVLNPIDAGGLRPKPGGVEFSLDRLGLPAPGPLPEGAASRGGVQP